MRKIDVDDEVFKVIESKSKPFVDKEPNDVLRRILKLTAGPLESRSPSSSKVLKRIPHKIPIKKFLAEEYRNKTYAEAVEEH